MTSIVNLFSNFDDLTKKKSIIESPTEYKVKKQNLSNSTPALSQGQKFKKYQKKIEKNLEKKIAFVNSKEGFEGLENIENIDDKMKLTPNGLAVQSTNIIQDNDFSSQQNTISNLQQEYKNTLSQYENLVAQITGSTTNYLNRVSPNNPYLNKTVRFTTGHIAYVTNQGVVKYIPSMDIWNSTTAPQQYTDLNIPWDDSWNNNIGAEIPTNPPLIAGTFMQMNQSLGNEGSNVFVDKLISNATPTYQGCYADNTSSPLMTFIGGSPPLPTNLINGNFEQPQISNNSYQYLSWNNTFVPGWNFNCVIVNNSSAWGYPMPYPHGNQCACIQTTQQLWTDWINFSAGVNYTLTFTACGRNCCDGSGQANPINIGIDGTTFYTLNPSLSWQEYSTNFTVGTTGGHRLSFIGTWGSSDRSTAFQNIQLSSSGSTTSGSYTYDQCKEAAIDSGYQYFALQDVNTSTSQGYCAVSNSEPTATSLGTGMTPSAQQPLWASNTASSQTSNPGSTATLTTSGALSVLNTEGQAVFNSDNSEAQPGNYLGCYGDGPNRAMPLYNGGSQQYSLQQCQQIAQQNNYSFFGLQNSTSGTNAQCGLSNNWSQTSEYGKAGNCTKISDGSWSGGGWSNAVYNTSLPNSNYFLVLQDDGNMCVYRGTSPSDNQGYIWCSMTNGKQQSANPAYAAANGKYGQNWMSSGSALAAGDFLGSTSGNLALIMQSDGNLVLYTFTMVENCQQMADGNTGGGVAANALYNIGKTAIPANMGKIAYVDQNSELHAFPSTNTQYSNTYSKIVGNDSSGYDIPGAAYGSATLENCQASCDNNSQCAGFVMNAANNICWPKTSGMYPNGARQLNSDRTIFLRGKTPATTPIGVPKTITNVDSIAYQNYIDGGAIGNEYGLANATRLQKQQLEQLQSQMNLLSSQINSLTGKFDSGSNVADVQSDKNAQGIQDYLKGINTTNNKIKNFNTNVENILSDSDIVVLQKNYDYLFWSILAAGTVLVTMNIVKK